MANIVKPSGINVLWAAAGTKVAPSLQKIGIGWVVELPPYQYQNWLDNRQDTFIAHINQHGIPEWDVETEYQGNLSYSQGSDGIIYKCLVTNTNFDPVNPLNSTYWVRAFEAYGSVAVVQNALTAHLTNYATLSGISNTVAARNNLSVFSKTESDARFAFKAGSAGQVFSVANATVASHAVPLGQLTSLLLAATASTAGQIAIATLGETETGTNDTKAVTPLKASTVFLKKSQNLNDLPNKATARSNLGLQDMALISSTQVLFKIDNLAGLTNIATARTNLGLGTAATQATGSFLQTANNLGEFFGNAATARANLGLGDAGLYPSNTRHVRVNNFSDVLDKPVARANLGLGTIATQAIATFLQTGNNLSELPDKPQARINLGLTAVSFADPNIFLYKGENLFGLTNVPQARANLGLSDSVLYPSNTWLVRTSNLGDLSNVQTARNNLGLGNLATANAFGILGPDINFVNNWDSAGGATMLPNGVKMQWGNISAGQTVVFRIPFWTSYSVTLTHGPNALGAPGAGITSKTLTSFGLGYGTGGYMWTAIGV